MPALSAEPRIPPLNVANNATVCPAHEAHTGRADNNKRAALVSPPTCFGGSCFRGLDNQAFRATATHSPINRANLHNALVDYPDGEVATQLKEGFQFGFRIGFTGERTVQNAANQQSIFLNIAIARQKIKKEIDYGRVKGPFSHPPMLNFRVSPLGMVPKKLIVGFPQEYRLIHNLSYPAGTSVNDNIDRDLCTVKYASFDDAAIMVQAAGPNCELAKSDIKSAFRLLPVHPADFDLLGFKFDGKYYFDTAMPMGCSVSCSIFEKFATFLNWRLRQTTPFGEVMHYLDDFLFVGRPQSGECARLLAGFYDLCSQLGVPIAH